MSNQVNTECAVCHKKFPNFNALMVHQHTCIKPVVAPEPAVSIPAVIPEQSVPTNTASTTNEKETITEVLGDLLNDEFPRKRHLRSK